MDHLAGVLLQVHFLDAHPLAPLAQLQLHGALHGEGGVELGDLVVLGHVRIEVVLALEHPHGVGAAVQGPGHQVGLAHRLAVQGGQHPGVAQADRADVGVGLVAEGRAQPQKTFERVVSWMWISRPMNDWYTLSLPSPRRTRGCPARGSASRSVVQASNSGSRRRPGP